MSVQLSRAVVVVTHSVTRSKCGSCLQKVLLSSGAYVPGAPVLHKRAHSLDSLSSGPSQPTLGSSSQLPRTERSSISSSLVYRNLSALAQQDQSHLFHQHNILDPGDYEENVRRVTPQKSNRPFILHPGLAKVVARHVDVNNTKSVIFECNPGPGVLTKTLLNAGAQRLVALEADHSFLPDLQELESLLYGQLEVVHCDFFRLDPFHAVVMKPPIMCSNELFPNLGISHSRWTDDIPVKVVGVLPQKNESSKLWQMIYLLFGRQSVFSFGRIEFYLFISEKQYLRLTAGPGNLHSSSPVLWQLACDIELLHKEPLESFFVMKKRKKKSNGKIPNDHMCLVRLRPRADLFSDGLTPHNAPTLMVMLKQCLAKRKARLIDKLNLWTPDCGSRILQELGIPKDILTGEVQPEQYLRLFKTMENSQEFTQSWLYKEILNNVPEEELC